MNARERWNQIIEILTDAGFIDVEDAAVRLGVSAATVRRDLDRLAQQQLITRTRGGAVSNSTAYDLPLRYNAERNVPQKVQIAEAASSRVAMGSVVAITGGTTTTEVARHLAMRADLHGATTSPALTIVTNAINIANELTVRATLQLVVVGGVVRSQSYELIGRLATLILDEISIDEAILGGNALDLVTGLTCHNESEAAIAAEIARRANRVTVVLDSTKLGNRALARACATKHIDTLITDAGADPDFVAELTARGIEVVIASSTSRSSAKSPVVNED
ncbi:DeoR/GlpR family DNA-binding transcription regulator [Mycolicibacterium komossense]|uniref:DeoR/GlpR transcriptional regulator n=1 Tax=Mycolicibacterium komossense TaxID=1779 RepID=A0ABT3C6N9_9MYCO|nr:DeoR/GlpR family DNA-binding transcription regulator [Mycolicibacterium komossense]MCV7225137.1 DeoR/GlpR transcriptional regulator [Mycolicibacterium komossense]